MEPRATLVAACWTAQALVAGCGAPEPEGQVGGAVFRIVGGQPSGAPEDFVVLLARGSDVSSGCTGTLVAPNLVLTARHCVSAVSPGPVKCSEAGEPDPSQEGGRLMEEREPASIGVFVGPERPGSAEEAVAHGKESVHDGAEVVCDHDIALLILDRDVEGIMPAPVRLDDGVVRGEALFAVGWGITEQTEVPPVRMRRDDVSVVRVGPSRAGAGQSAIPPNEFRASEAVCRGDSGGPALAMASGAVVGVASRGGNGKAEVSSAFERCEGATVAYTKLAPFRDLLLDAFARAGHAPWREGEANPFESGGPEAADGPAAPPEAGEPEGAGPGCSVARAGGGRGYTGAAVMGIALAVAATVSLGGARWQGRRRR